jgi:ubiquitin-like modifier-activating enzyme ATG7
MDDNVQ